MGMFEQAFHERSAKPLKGTLAEIQQILDRAQTPSGGLSEDQALAAIARLTRNIDDQRPVYQKPLG
jgi:hypothetical protein